jgi:hypothetical protein
LALAAAAVKAMPRTMAALSTNFVRLNIVTLPIGMVADDREARSQKKTGAPLWPCTINAVPRGLFTSAAITMTHIDRRCCPCSEIRGHPRDNVIPIPWRWLPYSRRVGYQGLSSRSSIQRQSGENGRA